MIVNIARIGTATVDYQTSCFARMRSKLSVRKSSTPRLNGTRSAFLQANPLVDQRRETRGGRKFLPPQGLSSPRFCSLPLKNQGRSL
jgi:hypothetical protein